MTLFISYYQFHPVDWMLQVARNLTYLDHHLTSMHRMYRTLNSLLNEYLLHWNSYHFDPEVL